jgi:hypothetical protein
MTDVELVEAVARRVMRWPFYRVSAHRPGSRPLPHAWQWPDGRVMVYDGKRNAPFDPVASTTDAAAVFAAMELRLTPIETPVQFGDAGGRRALCASALAIVDAEDDQPTPTPEYDQFQRQRGPRLAARRQRGFDQASERPS